MDWTLSTPAEDASVKSMKHDEDFLSRLQRFTEKALTKRKIRQLKEKVKQQKRNPILDWVYAIVWAACVVLVINQYFFQNYQIPSGSMEKTLLIGDMIFVDKLSFGPELLPGVAKMKGWAKPSRGQVIIFENPSYLSRGPIFTIAQQMIYMLTLTLVDIDRDQNGEQKVHYLIKRAVGTSGDTVKVVRGEVFIKPKASSSFIDEPSLMKGEGLPWKAARMVSKAEYTDIENVSVASAYQEAGLPLPASIGSPSVSNAYKDAFSYDMKRVAILRDINPAEPRYAMTAQRYSQGWYVPEGRIFPMGDNRDNSRDARYFGPVSISRVLGRALFIYWPFSRAGAIR